MGRSQQAATPPTHRPPHVTAALRQLSRQPLRSSVQRAGELSVLAAPTTHRSGPSPHRRGSQGYCSPRVRRATLLRDLLDGSRPAHRCSSFEVENDESGDISGPAASAGRSDGTNQKLS